MKLHTKNNQRTSLLEQAISHIIPYTDKLYATQWLIQQEHTKERAHAIISNDSRLQVLQTATGVYVNANHFKLPDWVWDERVLMREPNKWYKELQQTPQLAALTRMRRHDQLMDVHVLQHQFAQKNYELINYQIINYNSL